jgi:uncharacterized protein with FMN-binding domain
MKSKPKIIVLKLREIIYTLLLLFLVILLVVCLVLMFSRKTVTTQETTQSTQAASETEVEESLPLETARYTAGVYTTPVTLGDATVDVEVTVDPDHINSIRLVNLSESTAASYPLVAPSLENLTTQILETQKLEDITCPSENRYTSQLLLTAITEALALAQVNN